MTYQRGLRSTETVAIGLTVHESNMLSELDLALVSAMQIAPRATWPDLAQALGCSAATASRHWHQLEESGAAWVTAAMWSVRCLAFVDVHCTQEHSSSVAETLARDPHTMTVEVMASSSDLFVVVVTRDLHELSQYILERVQIIPGVRETTTRISTRLYRNSSDWRLDSLSREDISQLRGNSAAAQGFRPDNLGIIDETDRAILLELGLDGRASYAAIAEHAGISEVTARRRTARLLRTGVAGLRTEIAAPLAGWPVSAVLHIDAPTQHLQDAAHAIARQPRVRMCSTVASAPCLIAEVWLRSVEEIHEFEGRLVADVPSMRVVSRSIVLRTVLRHGRMIRSDGRAGQAIATDHWAPPLG